MMEPPAEAVTVEVKEEPLDMEVPASYLPSPSARSHSEDPLSLCDMVGVKDHPEDGSPLCDTTGIKEDVSVKDEPIEDLDLPKCTTTFIPNLKPVSGHNSTKKMDCARKRRRPNFNSHEILALLAGVKARYEVVSGPLSLSVTMAAKQHAWECIMEEVNAVSRVTRTREEVNAKFADFKCHTKKKMKALKRELTSTGGGGPGKLPVLTEAEEALAQLLGLEVLETMTCSSVSKDKQEPTVATVAEEIPSSLLVNEGLSSVLSGQQSCSPCQASVSPSPAASLSGSPQAGLSRASPSSTPHTALESHIGADPLASPQSSAPAAGTPLSSLPQQRHPSKQQTTRVVPPVTPKVLKVQQDILAEVRNLNSNIEAMTGTLEGMRRAIEQSGRMFELIANSLAEIAARK